MERGAQRDWLLCCLYNWYEVLSPTIYGTIFSVDIFVLWELSSHMIS